MAVALGGEENREYSVKSSASVHFIAIYSVPGTTLSEHTKYTSAYLPNLSNAPLGVAQVVGSVWRPVGTAQGMCEIQNKIQNKIQILGVHPYKSYLPPAYPPHRVLSQRLYLGAKRNFLGFGPARTGVPFSDRCTDDPKPFGP